MLQSPHRRGAPGTGAGSARHRGDRHVAAVRATVHGVTPYISTGAIHAAGVLKLLDGDTARTGFASGSKAFGHRYLLGFLEQRGLARATVTQL